MSEQPLDNAVPQFITKHIARVRRLLSHCAEIFESFDTEIVRILGLPNIGEYGKIIDSFYIFQDTELAKAHVRSHGLGTMADQGSFGLAYLKFYGVMNACYLQQQAALVCTKSLQLGTDLEPLKKCRVVQYRNDFAAHSANRGSGAAAHSFVLDRFGLLEGRVSGYSSNAPSGMEFRDVEVMELLAEWDACFLAVLAPTCESLASRIQAAGVHET
jgi:hypothetical protein